jgi:hypothetical protein
LFVFLVLVFVFVFSLCIPDCPGTHSVDQAGLEDPVLKNKNKKTKKQKNKKTQQQN